MHVNTYIFFEIFFVVWKYDVMIFFFILERLGRMHENNIFFWRKPGILIPDLYLYGIKIQTSIKKFW
jgi:hypothetical protein